MSFIDEHRNRFGGAGSIRRVLAEHGCPIDPSTYCHFKKRPASARALRDAELRALIVRAVRRTGTRPGKRDFVAVAPSRCRVADFTHVSAHAGTVYVAFVVDTFSRRILGWSAATTKAAPLVLGALEMGLWQRDQAGHDRAGLIHHSDARSQYTSFRLAAYLAGAGVAASIGTVSAALDNALMESTIGPHKTELIKRRGARTRPAITETTIPMSRPEVNSTRRSRRRVESQADKSREG